MTGRTGPAAADLRPDPVLAVGIAAQATAPAELERIVVGATTVLTRLAAECARIARRDAAFFSPATPRLRIVTRLAEPVERALAASAGRAGAEIGAVRLGADRPDAGPGPVHPAETLPPIRLPGSEEDDSARIRAAESVLDASDLLFVVWDGRPSTDRASGAALAQEAVERRMPVLVMAPNGSGEVEVIDDPDELLLSPVASELPRVRLADNLDRVLARAFAPPAGPEERRALRDCLAEAEGTRSFRPEYPALLLLAAGRAGPAAPEGEVRLTGSEEWARAHATAALISVEAADAIGRWREMHGRMEELAAFYGRRVRSGVVLRYIGPAVGSLTIALLAIVAPQLGLAWLGVQAVVMTLTISEATWAVRGRWDERWLDYRSLAERLRCDRFLVPLGVGTARLERETAAEDPAWTRWCHRRLVRSVWPAGTLTDGAVAAAFQALVSVEIAGQTRYHRAASLRFRRLARRLRLIGTGSILCIVAASLVLVGLAGVGREVPIVQALLTVLLITLPSLFLATRGLRLEGAFDLAAARSDQALAALRLLADRIAAAPPSFDRLVRATRAAAAAMILDTVDWRIGLQRSRVPYRAAPTEPAEAPASDPHR